MTRRGVACLTRCTALLLAVASEGAGQGGASPGRADAGTLTLWVGDTVQIGAPSRAEAPGPIGPAQQSTAAQPVWSSTDSSVATVVRDAVVGEGAGTARVTMRYDSVVVRLEVRVLPVVAGRVFAPADEGLTGLRALVRSRGVQDSADVSTGGAFAVRLSAAAAGEVELAVDAAQPGDRRFHPALVRLAPSDLAREVKLVLVPARWVVTSGRYAGRIVGVSAAAALRRTGDRSRFWRMQQGPRAARIVGWPQEQFPLPVAFLREEGDAIGPSDSAAFWAALDSLEADMGADLFQPARYEDVRGHKDGIIVEIDREQATAGLTLASWNQDGRIVGATVSFRTADLLGDAHVATHEMMHALGFGHTTSWPSVMATGSRRPTRPTLEDVAHAQLLFRVLDAQRLRDAPYGILDAEEGERRLGRGWDRDATGAPERTTPPGP